MQEKKATQTTKYPTGNTISRQSLVIFKKIPNY